jgi:superfamily II DNA or RNA helicase
MRHEPRYYQEEAYQAARDYWNDGGDHGLIVKATGTGKSLLQAMLAQRLIAEFPGFRIACVTNSQELIEQNYGELLGEWSFAPAGIFSASLGRRESQAQILFCGIDTVHNKTRQIGHVDLLIVDEAHRISKEATTRYARFIQALLVINPEMRILGLTATDYRTDSGRLTEGDERLFNDVIYEYGISDGIADGYLTPLVSKATVTGFDMTGVKKSMGDFAKGAMQSAVDKTETTRSAVAEIVAAGTNRRSWLAFCAGVEHAGHVRDEIRSHGITCEMITGDKKVTPSHLRRKYIEDFKSGKIRCLTNNSVLTTGFNAPGIDLIAGLRPTLSPGLLVQMAGRGTRNVYAKGMPLDTVEQRLAAIAAGPKPNCIAEGQRVLTDVGLVTIENITKSMKVWDGNNFVSHDGIIFKGMQTVVSYAGLTATADHNVWTKEGWKTFGRCASEQTAIAITGIGRKNIQQSDGSYRCSRAEQSRTNIGRVHEMPRAIVSRLFESDKITGWLQSLRKSKSSAAVVGPSRQFREVPLRESERSGVREIRQERYSVQVRKSHRDGGMGTRELGASSRIGIGSNRKRSSLRGWKSKIFDSLSKSISYALTTVERAITSISPQLSERSIRGRHNETLLCEKNDREGNRGQILQSEILQTKRPVWDICNAGPLHRFTCEGLLVSNCLYLDFAGNIMRHGPIDAITPRKPGEGTGEAPVKECEQCRSLVHISLRICPDCGFVFPVNEKPKHSATSAAVPILSTEAPKWLNVQSRKFYYHENAEGSESVRVDFLANFNSYKLWLSVRKAKNRCDKFWRDHVGREPYPADVEEWLSRCENELRATAQIQVRPKGKFWEIVGIKPAEQHVVVPAATQRAVPPRQVKHLIEDDIPF